MCQNQLKKNFIAYVFIVAAGLLLLYSIVPYLKATAYVVPVADDLQSRPGADVNYFSYAFQSAMSVYLGWQGTYISDFLYSFFSPLARFGVNGIRIFCFFSILLFNFSLWVCIYSVSKHILGIAEKWKIFAAFAMISMLIANAHSPKEVFFWYTGICVYTFPMSLTLIGIGLLICYMRTSVTRYWIGAVICGFIVGGGVLQCGAVVCYFYLAIVVWAKLSEHPHWIKMLIAFFVSLISTLINVCAPGNYVRHDVIDESNLYLFKSIRFSFAVVGNEMINLLKHTDFLLLIGCFVLLGVGIYRYGSASKVKLLHLVFWFIGLLGIMCVSTYPVVLGYSKAAMPDRGYFILDTLAVISAFIGSFLFGGYLAGFCSGISDRIMGIMLGIIVVVFAAGYVRYGSGIDRPVTQCIADIRSGTYEQFRDTWEEVYRQIEESRESNVIAETKAPPASDILMNPNISSDSSFWINGMVSAYYGKESVSVVWSNE